MINKRRLLINSAKSLAALPLLSSCTVGGNLLSSKGESNWLAGGTKAMTAEFPPKVPFKTAACKLTPETGVGPCYFNNVSTEDDVSEGLPGIPMVIALKFVKENCEPIEEGALVEVWWTDNIGVYSADTSDSTNGTSDALFTPESADIEVEGGVPPYFAVTCAILGGGNNQHALTKKWSRGKKLTDTEGCIYLKGCFPGWYSGRAAHIHLRVTRIDGSTYDTQLGYDEGVASSIYLNHPDYTGKDEDVTNDVDPWFARLPAGGNNLEVLRQSDGSMLSYKTLAI